MAKKQTRRSVSVRPEAYCRAEDLAALGLAGDNPTQVVDAAIHALCEKHGVPAIERDDALNRLRARAPSPTPKGAPEKPIVSQYFTF